MNSVSGNSSYMYQDEDNNASQSIHNKDSESYNRFVEQYRKERFEIPFESIMQILNERVEQGDETARAQRGALRIAPRNKDCDNDKAWDDVLTAAARKNDYACCLGARIYIYGGQFDLALEFLLRGAICANSYIGAEMGGIFQYLGIGWPANLERAKLLFAQANQIVPYGSGDGSEARIEFCEMYKDDIVLGLKGDCTKLYEIGKCFEIRGMFDFAMYWFLMAATLHSGAAVICVDYYHRHGIGGNDYVFELESLYFNLTKLAESREKGTKLELKDPNSFATRHPIMKCLFKILDKTYDAVAKVAPIPQRSELTKKLLKNMQQKEVKNFLNEQKNY